MAPLKAFFGSAFFPSLTCILGCGGATASAPPPSPAVAVSADQSAQPKAVVEDPTETWHEEPSGKGNEKGSGVREYVLDVTKETGVKGSDAGPTSQKIYRVSVRFPVPKVEPAQGRDVHTVNRLLWEERKETAKCFYKGPGKEPGTELSMIGFIKISQAGEIASSGVEWAHPSLQVPGFGECVMENVNKLVFGRSPDDVKVRFKLKFQTSEVTDSADVKAPTVSPSGGAGSRKSPE
ncbi:MAG: hypothetical protein NVS3B20_15450 [Polyangiales bacterium]